MLRFSFRRGDLMGMAAPMYYSAASVRALPEDGKRYETVHGELLVTPSPRLIHQRIVRRLLVALDNYLEREPVGEVFTSPADISWSDDTLVQPDLFVADPSESSTQEWSRVKTLLLVVEVLSPGTARFDRFTKRRLYQEHQIPLYWIVDPDRRMVEVWRPEMQFPEVERERLIWLPAGTDTEFQFRLDGLFGPL